MFDPARVLDRSTYREPSLPPAGIEHVLVNGTAVVARGRSVDGVTPGTAMRALVQPR
jgi:N-acyl-D-aspartate/D-glutamate deacylase